MFGNLSQWFQSHVRVGLTFADDSLRLALLKGGTGHVSAIRTQETALEPGIIVNGILKNQEACQAKLKGLVRKLKANRKQVCFTIPDSQLIVRQFELPGVMTDQDLRNYFFIEMGKKIQLPFKDPIFDFHVLNRAADGTNVVLYAAPETVVRQYVHVLRSAGLEPVAAEFNAIGVDRWIHYIHKAVLPEHRMYARLEKATLSVSILHNDVPLFARQVHLGTRGADSADEAADLYVLNAVTEIDRMMNFYQFSIQKGSGQVAAIYLLNEKREQRTFGKVLSDTVHIPVEPVPVDDEKTGHSIQLSFIPAIGSAMKELVS
ncbi:pilus assembly protein PilM [Sporolactobacillus sp. Y61]|uniref:Pilus assembly protein PilM n=1 Tax=Sporolactobacillus sp. Y61 TaxID=3160863 RepID=A0AAU8IEG2_9BACL